MRIDLYTKSVLTVIAVLLAVIAFKQYVSPDAVAHAQGSFAGLQFTAGDGGSINFFDSRTGEIWKYFNHIPTAKYRLTKLGQPMVKEK